MALALDRIRVPALEMVAEGATLEPAENLRRGYLCWNNLARPSARVRRNEACVVLGKFLEAGEETYPRRAQESGIPILWRASGGGAVLQDPGNINYSIYLRHETVPLQVEESLKLLSFPATALLETLGLPREWVPPNNIFVAGRKISGSAQARSGGRLLHHGALLVDCDLAMMHRA